jgi:hypothetical protein
MTLPACGLFAQAGALFSEDFESGQLDSKVWEKRVSGVATIQVEQYQVAHGKYALQVHYPEMATQTYAFLFAPHLPGALKGHLFGRAYMKIAPALPESHTVLFLSGGSGWPISKFEELGASHGTLQPSYQENKSPRGQGRGEDVRHGIEAYPKGKWFLLEWEFNDDPSTLTIWVDGERSPVSENGQKADLSTFIWPKASDNTKNLVGGFEEFGLGARVWGAVPIGFDVYYDDIAIDTKRIGPVK